jgi:hypothetical protein
MTAEPILARATERVCGGVHICRTGHAIVIAAGAARLSKLRKHPVPCQETCHLISWRQRHRGTAALRVACPDPARSQQGRNRRCSIRTACVFPGAVTAERLPVEMFQPRDWLDRAPMLWIALPDALCGSSLGLPGRRTSVFGCDCSLTSAARCKKFFNFLQHQMKGYLARGLDAAEIAHDADVVLPNKAAHAMRI